MLRRMAIMLTITLSILCLTSGPASADKLVLFKNGKAMRVKSVTSDGQWLRCEFEDRNFLSVRASSVLGVEDAVVGSQTGELRPNQVAVGVGGGFNPGPAGIGAGGLPPEVQQQSAADEAQDQADLQAAIAEEQAARNGQPVPQPGQQQYGVNNGFGRRGSRIGGQPQANPFQPGGLQPLNQNGSVVFPNRGLRGRQAVPGGPIRATQPITNTNQNQNQDN